MKRSHLILLAVFVAALTAWIFFTRPRPLGQGERFPTEAAQHTRQ